MAAGFAPDVPAALPLPDPGIPSPFSSFLPLAPAVWGRLREGAESYAKALASDILR